MYRWYCDYKAHGLLPYAGGSADQPEWIWRDFNRFGLIEAYLKTKAQSETDGG